MSKLTRVTAAVARALAWLLPAGRRDWAEAVWAEAYEVPAGLARLAWRAGGVWVLAREALLPRRLGRALLVAAAAAFAAWAAWPQPGVGHVILMQSGDRAVGRSHRRGLSSATPSRRRGCSGLVAHGSCPTGPRARAPHTGRGVPARKRQPIQKNRYAAALMGFRKRTLVGCRWCQEVRVRSSHAA